MKPVAFSRMAALLFVAEAAFAVAHHAVGGRYVGYTSRFDAVIDGGLAAMWGASAIVALVRRPSGLFYVMLAGTALTFIHFMMFSVSTSDHGPYGASLPWLLAFAVQAYWVVHAAPSFFSELPRDAPEPESEGSHGPGWVPWLRVWHR